MSPAKSIDVRRGLVLIPMDEWTEVELRSMLADAEGEYQWWNIAKRVREEMARRDLEAPPKPKRNAP